ncbi:mobile element protein [Rhodovulum sulfidophilum]|uniref:Mobile element protein n=1 Tax=Rhodovulum sulfidophilum TaxID=35806 RepID=A0A0D6B5U0_RHOSU|nr:mobile element protein [Rhodovulum sulfidophilum]
MVFRGDGEPFRAVGPRGNGERRKVHMAMDTATSGIRAVASTPGREGDSPVLLEQILDDDDIGTVTTTPGAATAPSSHAVARLSS